MFLVLHYVTFDRNMQVDRYFCAIHWHRSRSATAESAVSLRHINSVHKTDTASILFSAAQLSIGLLEGGGFLHTQFNIYV
jgi:hypothetical protein